MEAFRLTGKTAIVTGAGAGLGNSMAAGLAEAGARVALIDIRPDIGEIAKRMCGDGRELVGVQANLTALEGCTIGDWADGGGESGEAEDLGYSIQNDGSYTVYNADGLLAWNKAAQKDESINCTLTADIDLTGKDWTQIGTWPGYSGVFNGQGHRITGLNFSAATTELFGLLNLRGVIKNLQLIDVNLYGNNGSAAGIVDQNNGQIIACSVTGKISAYSNT